MRDNEARETEMTSHTFKVMDRVYRGWKTVVVEGTTRAAAQAVLLAEGQYTQIRRG